MVLVLVPGVWLGGHRARVQREAVAAIKKNSGGIYYEWDVLPDRTYNLNGKPAWPEWLVERVGVDYFGDVVGVYLGSNATDEAMAAVARLDRLRFFRGVTQQVTDAGMAALQGKSRLEEVRLIKNDPFYCFGVPPPSLITGASLAHLRGLPRLRVVELGEITISDSDLTQLEGLPGLRELSIRSESISDAGLAHLAKLGGLTGLDLCRTRVTDAGLDRLLGLDSLETLELYWTEITDAGLLKLARLKGLKKLDLLGNSRLTASGIAGFARLRPTVAIDQQ